MPHRPPILCVDTIVRVDTQSAVTEHTVAAGQGDTDQWEGFLIEGLAQTAAVLNGYANDGAGRGLLVGLKNLEIHRRARPGDTLRFEVELVRRLPPLVLVTGRARSSGEILAEGELKFFVEQE